MKYTNKVIGGFILKQLFILVCIIFSSSTFSFSQLIAYEGFDYSSSLSDGESIAGANGGTGWAEEWNVGISSADGSYKTEGLSSNHLEKNGGSLLWATSDGGYGRAFDATIGGSIDLSSGGTVWFSYLIRMDNGVEASFRTLFFCDVANSAHGIGAEFTSNGHIMGRITGDVGTSSTKSISFGEEAETELVIGKIVYGGTTSGSTTSIDLWLNPADYSDETALGTPDATFSKDGSELGTHSFGNSTDMYLRFYAVPTVIDEIRLGLGFEDITPVKISTDASLSDLTVDDETLTDFDPSVLTYNVELPYGTETVPAVSYALNDAYATAIQVDAESLPGSTTVKVTAEDESVSQTYTINFTIADAVEVTEINISGSTEVEVGSSVTLSLEVLPSNATDPGVIWSTSNSSVATVDQSGLVTGIAAGDVLIKASAVDNSEVEGEISMNVVIPAGINDAELSIGIYPNPASDYLFIELNTVETAQIQVYDMKGSLRLSQNIALNNNAIDLSELENGFYSLKITAQNEVLSHKFFKMSR